MVTGGLADQQSYERGQHRTQPRASRAVEIRQGGVTEWKCSDLGRPWHGMQCWRNHQPSVRRGHLELAVQTAGGFQRHDDEYLSHRSRATEAADCLLATGGSELPSMHLTRSISDSRAKAPSAIWRRLHARSSCTRFFHKRGHSWRCLHSDTTCRHRNTNDCDPHGLIAKVLLRH